MSDCLLILGASARAAAFSANRAGYTTFAADSFGDVDLLACCCARRVGDYPSGLIAAADAFPVCPWMYTGALENHPRLVDRIGTTRPLLGNPGRVIRGIRHPFQLADALRRSGLPSLDVSHTAPRPGDGLWVEKPFHSAGGSRITFVNAETLPPDSSPLDTLPAPPDPEPSTLNPEPSTLNLQPSTFNPEPSAYFQRFVQGTPCSAVYVAAGGRATFLGATRQLIGARWTGASGFQYAGSLGPLPPDDRTDRLFEQIGNCLAEHFGLVGLFGVDAVLANGAVWPVEVNPRYTASVEVLEQSLDTNFLPLHVHACRHHEIPSSFSRTARQCAGKAVVYATWCVEMREGLAGLVTRNDTRWPTFADVPATGTTISPGQPILTVLAAGPQLVSVYHQLRTLVRQVQLGVRCFESQAV